MKPWIRLGRYCIRLSRVLEQGEGLLAGGEGLLVVAEQGVVPADRVEGDGDGLPDLVAGGPIQVERPSPYGVLDALDSGDVAVRLHDGVQLLPEP